VTTESAAYNDGGLGGGGGGGGGKTIRTTQPAAKRYIRTYISV